MKPGNTPIVIAARKLTNWGSVEAHRLESQNDDLLAVTTPLPESGRNAGRDGSKTYRRPDDIPSLMADHIDIDNRIKSFPVASLPSSVPAAWRSAEKIREILRWRFAYGRTTDDFPVEDLNLSIAELPLRGDGYQVKEFLSSLVVAFIKSVAAGIEQDIASGYAQ